MPEFYLPHKFVRENAESTKVCIVYDGSVRADNQSKSLNEYLEPGPNVPNQIWKMLVQTRFNPIAICGDFKEAFLQIKSKKPTEMHCIKISLDKRSQLTKNRKILIHKTGVWTYINTVCTRHHSSTSLAELYQHI